MARVLYNEGRVVGYSAYEIYIQQLKAVDPDATPATEKEWLASMLANGTSMLLRVGSDSVDGAHYIDVELPSDSRLCAANTIFASFFSGAGYIGTSVEDTDSVWSTKVVDYGNLISNTAESSPSGTTVPTKEDIEISDDMYNQIVSYMQITDGIVIQPGTWVTNTNTPPAKDFSPTLSETPILRISFADRVETPFFMLLTGLTDKGVIAGVTGLNSSVNTNEPENGDFLGPAAFPWSAKVIFSVPPFAMKAVFGNSFKYTRNFQNRASATVDSVPIIDYATDRPNAKKSGGTVSAYGSRYDAAAIGLNVSELDINRPNAAVIGTYSIHPLLQDYNLPPAIYAGRISEIGVDEKMFPLDVMAPDCIHMYQDCTDYEAVKVAKAVEPNSYAFVRNPESYIINEYDRDTAQFVPIAGTRKTNLLETLVSEPRTLPLFYVEGQYLRDGLVQKWTGVDYATTGHQGGDLVDPDDVIASRENPDTWYIEVDSSIQSQYTLEQVQLYQNGSTSEVVQGLKGDTVLLDPLKVCHIGCLMYRKLTGRLSDKVKADCGYTGVYDASGNKAGQFAGDGIWADDANAGHLFNQIEATDRHNYYAVFPMNEVQAYSYPVRESDDFIEVTSKYIYNIYINGVAWNIPCFRNTDTTERSSKYLGSWWNANSSGSELTVTTYQKDWAIIYLAGQTHPTAYSAIVNSETGESGQIYQKYAMLPQAAMYDLTMTQLFGTTLNGSGILAEYMSYTVKDFLYTALYTDMGTGQPLPSGNPNILMAATLYSNGYDPDTQTYSRTAMQPIIPLNVANSAANSGKTQLVFLPDKYVSIDETDPVGVVIETGRQQAFTMSMTDANGTPYSMYGTGGTMDVVDPGKITWYQLLAALAANKAVNVLGDKGYIELNGLRLYISSTAPTGTIAEGSIGIGWGTTVHTYTSGAWS